MRNARRFLQLAILMLAVTAAWAFLPDNLRDDDAMRAALYRTETFRGQEAHVPLPPSEAKQKLLELAQSQPQSAEVYKSLSEVDVQLLDFPSAEAHLRQYLQNSADKDAAFEALEDYYHSRLQFDAELKIILERARTLKPTNDDVSRQIGAYLYYRKALTHIQHYGLTFDPTAIYQTIVDTYPSDQQPYLDYINYVKDKQPQKAQAMLLQFKQKFPNDAGAYLRASCSLMKDDQAFALLDKNFQPLWDLQMVKLLDSYAVSSGKKADYLTSLKDRLRKNPLDFDAVSRAFYSYHVAGSAAEAQQVLSDFRLLKEQAVREGKTSWTPTELYTMAQLSHLLLNFDDEARYDYSLYWILRDHAAEKTPGARASADDALYGLFRVLITADQRPLQIGAGNIDYYKDIATADTHPGVLNGILSLIFNSAHPASEWKNQHPQVLGYYNRAQALRLIFITQRDYPSSEHLPSMYRDALSIYEKYAMNDLIVQAGEQFFKTYPKSPEILDVGVSVTDAYSRLNDHEKEWKTYEFLLPIAAAMQNGPLISGETPPNPSAYEKRNEESGNENSGEEEGNEEEENPPQQQPRQVPANTQQINYETLLNRYISSLTQQKNYIAVVNLYKAQITQHPREQGLYENFASFLSANQLLEDEAKVYQQAIQQFKEKSWYEKLARWYLRNKRDAEFENISHQIIDTFAGTEVASYLQQVVPYYANPYRALNLALNQYAHHRFPYNLTFVRNLMGIYESIPTDWNSWEALAAQYYQLDETIRNSYLKRLSSEGNLPGPGTPSNTVEKRFAGDVELWRSHYEEAIPYFRDLSTSYSSDRQLNLLLADLTRSLGAEDPANYDAAAGLREHLAKIEPSDSALWTTAGETMADVEAYDRAKAYWQNILKIDPQNPERYLEVATILWDYYLFDDALATIEQSRKIKNDPELFAYEAGAIQESRRRYDLAIAEYSKSLLQASESAKSRLIVLYGRPKLTPIVRATLEQRLKDNPQESGWWTGIIGFYAELKERDTAHDLISRAMTTLKPEEFRKAAATLKETAGNLGFIELQDQMLQLAVTRSATEMDRIQATLDLARFYEAESQDNRAEATYRDLYTKMPRSAGIINELLSYYWRSEKYDKAFALYNEILPAANANYRKQYLLESARRHVERKDYAPALAAARELSTGEPLNTEYFQLIAEIYAGQQNYPALADHYKQGLELVRKSDLPDDQKKAQIASLRRGIISANLILKDSTAALDQYIEILNRDAENTAVLSEVSGFAMKYKLFDRLVDYYTRTAQASPKDHRWPMMLARLHFYSGEFQTAINEFNSAIAIRPERTDLRRELADCYQRLGRYEDAIAVYEKLYAMTYKDKRWLDPLSELNARLGNRAKAIDLYTQSLPSDQTPVQRNFAIAGKAMEWDMAAEAVKYGDLAMRDYDADLSQPLESNGFQRYTEALVRSGASIKAFDMLVHTYDRVQKGHGNATFDAETLRSAEYTIKDEMLRDFPELIKRYLSGDQLQAVDNAVLQSPLAAREDWARDIFLPMVRGAGLAHAEEQLLTQLVANSWKTSDSSFRTYRSQLRNFYTDRHQFAKCAAAESLERQWLTPQDDQRDDLLDLARNYRLAGMQDNEVAILREYFQIGTRLSIQPEPVERYLSLLYTRGAEEELNRAADAGSLVAANYFLKHEDNARSVRAVNAIARNKPPVWGSIQHAMLAREFRDPVSAVKDDYRIGLDLRSIGEQLMQSSNNNTSVHGDAWFFYATKYGEHLWWSGQHDEASYFLTSDLEGAPTSAPRQSGLGDFYLDEKNYEKALQHYTFASQLDPHTPEYQDRMASAMYLLGRKDEALALWREMISPAKAPRYELLLSSAQEYDFVDLVRKDVEDFLQKRTEQSGSSGLGTLLPQYLGTVTPDSAVPLVAKWIAGASDPLDVARLILNDDELDPKIKSQVLRSARESLKTRMASSTGSERQNLRSQFVSWSLRYSKHLLQTGDAAQAMAVTQGAMEHTTSSEPIRDKLTLQQCRALIRTGKKADALNLLKEYVKPESGVVNEESYRTVSDLLDAEGLKAESLDFREEMYERLIATGRTDDANYAGLAGIKLDRNQPDDAKSLLQKMIYSSSENLNGFHVAAEIMEEHDRTADAIAYRQELAKRLTYDMKNLARLSQDLLKAGKEADAARTAAAVLQSDLSTLEDRAFAARVYAKAGGLNVAGPAEMQDLERTLRASRTAPGEAATHVYYRSYRAALIEDMESPPLDLLLAEKYLDPDDKTLNVKLFEAYRHANRCDLALLTLDPNQASLGDQYQGRRDDDSEFEDSYYSYFRSYPVETLNLSTEKTRDLALEMAECAEKTGVDVSRIFYLQMALHHTSDAKEKAALLDRIHKAQDEWDTRNSKETQRYKVAENLGRES